MTVYCGNSTGHVCTVSIPHSTSFILSIFDDSTLFFLLSACFYVLIVPTSQWPLKINNLNYDRNSINDVCTISIPHSTCATN